MEHPPTAHQVLLELLGLGLSLAEAKSIGAEEMLCLLHHARLRDDLAALEAEAARVASLPFADAHDQQRALARLGHHAQARLARFYSWSARVPAGDWSASVPARDCAGAATRSGRGPGLPDR